ncbi:MAG TPA: RsmB/NOP family class I SAM-dependent RNA methyltransferase [Candidatus Sulfotelmatobacter sp.]|jgi:NOL1/NOP2/sun family putative RNA methylase|nr:RsmB/NOP family class I SAM-dependent RNA methyltransferase [Candidatus Sulfotelmatobacter sp.]
MDACNNLPIQLLERWKKIYSEKYFNQLLDALSHPYLPSFRANTLKTSSRILQKLLEQQNFIVEKVYWYPDAFVLKNKSIRELTETAEYKNGLLYIQNLSSMIPALVLHPKPNEKVLDITAAPGSKTTQIAAMMHNTGELTANDLSFKRLFKLKENLNHMGITNTKVLNLPGESFWKNLPEYFDKTLVDVPCSMEGRIKCNDPKTYKDWSTKKIKQLSKLQKYLLRSAISATRIGGIIVYSTCTLSPEENEEVIEWIMKKTPEALRIEKINLSNIPLQNGLLAWKKKQFMHTTNCARIFPSKEMEGFFITKIYKITSTLPLL